MQTQPSGISLPLIVAFIHLGLLGLMAGFFYAYSVNVMPALDMLAPEAAIAAMQAINEAVRNPVFFATFFLTPVIGAVSALLFFRAKKQSAARYSALAATVYFLLALMPTAMINVPMNETLALVEVSGSPSELADIWKAYSADWTFWNTTRTLTSSIALMLGGAALWAAGRA